MTRKQLEALLAAGLITATAFTAALATRTAFGTIAEPPVLELNLAAAAVELPDEDAEGDEARIIRGTVSVYDELIPSHGMIIHAGALELRDPILDRIKLLRDHDMSDPVGYMIEWDEPTLAAAFQLPEGENEDRALLEASPSHRLRDGLSVGFLITEYDFDDDWILHVRRAQIHEVSLCAIPALSGARVTSVAAALATNRKEDHTMNRAQLAAALAAGTITQAQHDEAIATLELVGGTPAAAPAVPAELAAGPENHPQAPPAVQVNEHLSFRDVVRRVSAAANTGDPQAVALELADVIPANDAGDGYVNRPEWLGELEQIAQTRRPYIEAIGTPQPLNALRGEGWRWEDRPEVEEYAGNKTDVPSNTVSTVKDEYVGFRVAAGWDIDRAFVDFGDEQFLTDFWKWTMVDYQRKSEAGIRTRVKALAANAANTVVAGGVKAILKQLIRDARKLDDGSLVNRIFLSDTLFEELEDLDTEHLPLWLKSAVLDLDVATGDSNVGQLRIGLDSTLAAGEALAFDNRALIVREKQIPQIRAINVAQGGIDLGFTSYLRLDDVDPRLVFRRKYVAAPVV